MKLFSAPYPASPKAALLPHQVETKGKTAVQHHWLGQILFRGGLLACLNHI